MKKWLIDLLKSYFFSSFPYIVVFTATLYHPSDSDLGWHLKYGEYFFTKGKILLENIYSTNMPQYRWINSSWLTDLISFIAYDNFSFLALSLLGAIIITLTFYFIVEANNLSFFHRAVMIPIILYFEAPLFQVSFRGHLITLLFISILYFLFKQFEKGNNKLIYFTIPLFLLWSNFHGEYILGLALFFSLITLYILKETYINHRRGKEIKIKANRFLFSVFTASFFATLLNPFGWKIYKESFKHFNNPLQQYIVEWLPFEKFSYLWWNLLLFNVLLIISLIIIYKQKKILSKIHYIFPAVLLSIFSFWIRRYTWPMIIVSIPIITTFISEIKPRKQLISKLFGVFILVSFYLYSVIFKIPNEYILNMSWDRYCFQFVSCSPDAAQAIIEKKLTSKLLTFYNWGGWLIFNYYPEIKPSIDGRMHLWRDNKGYSAFKDYYYLEQNWDDIDKSDYDVVLMTPTKPLYDRLMELVNENKWEVVYKDDFASVFVRISTSQEERS